MTFIWPWMLLSLLALPLLLVYARGYRRRRQQGALDGAGVFRSATPPGKRRRVPLLFSLAGLTCLLFALARPEMPLRLPRAEGTVILAFDVSASMAADDLEPSRMDAAKAAAATFIDAQPATVRIGVLAFSDGGLLVQPPTDDRAELLLAVNRLTPQSGTSLGQGILAGLNAILAGSSPPPDESARADDDDPPAATARPTPLPSGSMGNAVIVLITDGENLAEPDPIEAAERAADYGVRVHTVGMGSAAGGTVVVDGITVATRLDEPLLREISAITGGDYFAATSRDALVDIYATLARSLTVRAEPMEITAVVSGLGLLLMLIGAGLSLAWFGRML